MFARAGSQCVQRRNFRPGQKEEIHTLPRSAVILLCSARTEYPIYDVVRGFVQRDRWILVIQAKTDKPLPRIRIVHLKIRGGQPFVLSYGRGLYVVGRAGGSDKVSALLECEGRFSEAGPITFEGVDRSLPRIRTIPRSASLRIFSLRFAHALHATSIAIRMLIERAIHRVE